MGYALTVLPPFSLLASPVATHPDMLLFPLGECILLHETYYRENKGFFDALPFSFVTTSEPIGKDYPQDILLNALPWHDTVYGHSAISQTIKGAFPRHIPVKQGYTRCSAAMVGKGVITQDKTLFCALQANGVRSLLIRPGHIRLDGYDYGFIGGASVALSQNLTAFFGKIESHPDYIAMQAFAKEQNAELLSLSDEMLCDCGGGFLF